jgi:hypothetical protein
MDYELLIAGTASTEFKFAKRKIAWISTLAGRFGLRDSRLCSSSSQDSLLFNLRGEDAAIRSPFPPDRPEVFDRFQRRK